MAGYQYAADDVILYFGKLCPTRTVELTSSMIERYQNWERKLRQPNYSGEYAKKVKYKDGRGIENTVKHRTTLIRSVLQYAKRAGIIDRNVASTRDCQIDLPNPQRHKFPVLSVEEGRRLLRALRDEPLWFRVAIAIALLLGLRRSEIIGLRVEDIDRANGRLTVCNTVTQQTIAGKNTITIKPFTKNRRPKIFVISKALQGTINTLLESHKENEILFGKDYDQKWSGYVIRYPDGRLVTPNVLTTAFSNFIKKNNFKGIRLHDLRHSCASILYANGMDLLTLQEIMGHAQLATTLIYTHIINEKKETAINIMSSQLMDDKE